MAWHVAFSARCDSESTRRHTNALGQARIGTVHA
jgi:hypothetical protein